MSHGSLALAAYLALSASAGPAARALLASRARRGKEDAARLGERLGHPGRPRPEGPLVWLHAASVGEAMSALPLIEALGAARPELAALITTGTVTAATRVAPLLPAGAVHQFAPIDTRAAVRRFLDHWRPDLAIWIESELWPRMIFDTAARGVPMALVNARISARSARGWARWPRMAHALLRPFALVLAQDDASAERLAAMGGQEVAVTGNLKSAVAPPDCAAEALAEARAAIGARPVWLAASTHEGEEEAVADATAALPPEMLTLLAPRHPARGAEVAALLGQRGLATARRSLGEAPGAETRVWLADTLGEMGLWFRLAPVAFVAGSLAPRGGHTPFEPAALGTAILHGPHTENFAPAYAALEAAGGAMAIADGASLATAVAELLSDPARRAEMAAAARAVRARETPDLDAIATRLLALMDRQ